ncbi:MAG: hypothetical protein ABSD59_09260 [Terracidiphilus sp.]|jgi:hypothetical protein
MILRRRGRSVFFGAWLGACALVTHAAYAQHRAPGIELPAPIAVYVHEPASTAPTVAPSLSEGRALDDLDQLTRLKKSGVRVDYDLLDASVIAPDGLHPAGHNEAWPNGLEPWIARCRAAGIYPGLRFGAPGLHFASNALGAGGRASALVDGPLLPDFVATMQSWYDRGIRLFVFDGINLTALTAAPSRSTTGLTPDQIFARNAAALRDALTQFRTKNRGAVLLTIESDTAYSNASTNPRSDTGATTNNPEPHEEANRIGAFLLLSTGPPHPSDRPQTSLQRAIDIETDSQVRRDEKMGIPLPHIFSTGLIAAPADPSNSSASSPHRDPLRAPSLRGWKGAFLLSMARGGWIDTLSGNLDSIATADARWMARVERLFFAVQAKGQMRSFGGAPLDGQPYGFAGRTSRGAVYVVVNPSQSVAKLALAALGIDQPLWSGRVLFRDAGFSPRLTGNAITLGPGQMAVVGFGAYAAPKFNFGVQQDVVIPKSIEPVDADFHLAASGELEASFDPPIEGVLRVTVRERAPDEGSSLDSADAYPAGQNHRFTFEITQADRPIPLRPESVGSDGESSFNARLSWAVAEIDVNDLTPGIPLRVRILCDEKSAATLEASAYQVIY